MNRPRRAKYCWDTSVFLAWIKEEPDAPLDDIALVVDEIDDDKADLIIPVAVFCEILEAKHTKRQMRQFDQFSKRSNVLSVDTTRAIAQRASELRSALLREGRKLKTPDAQIAATAILYGVDMLHSLDPHLLNIHGSPAVDGLVIVKPRLLGGQRALPGFRPSSSDADQLNDLHDEPENAGG